MRALFAIIASIIIYGSIFPFDFVWPSFEQVSWWEWTTSIEQRTTNGDRLSNLLIFVPLGFFGYFYNPFKSKLFINRLLTVLLVCGVFAYLLQLAQFFTPRRVPTVGDVFYNVWGALFGIILGSLIESFFNKNRELSRDWFQKYSVSAAIAFFGLLFFLFPFFFQVDIDIFVQGANPIWTPPWILPIHAFVLFAYWLSLLMLLKYNEWLVFTLKTQVMFIFAVFFLKIISAHNYIDLNWIIAACCALIIVNKVPGKLLAPICLGGLSIALILSAILPWKVKMIFGDFNYIPLNSYLNGSLWLNTRLFLEKIFLYGSLLFFAKAIFGNWKLSMFFSLGLVLMVELLQLFISLGQADITEVLIVLVLAYIFQQLENVKTSELLSSER